MANEQAPLIRVIGFKTTYEIHPKRGSAMDDNVDAKGFLIDEKGRRVMENIAVDWVIYAPAQSPMSTQNIERVRNLAPSQDRIGNDQDGVKYNVMAARWAQIEPSYLSWKGGQGVPINGTPLTVWPGVNPGQVEIFRNYGIRSIEEVRDLTDSQRERIRLPNILDLQKQAQLFLDNTNAAMAAAREADKDDQLAAMAERLAEMEKLLDHKTAPASKDADTADDEVTALRAELDAKGIAYDRRWAAPRLRSALTAEAA